MIKMHRHGTVVIDVACTEPKVGVQGIVAALTGRIGEPASAHRIISAFGIVLGLPEVDAVTEDLTLVVGGIAGESDAVPVDTLG